jgi:hypothetical protein
VYVTIEQAIGIYARASRRWFGEAALRKTAERIEALHRSGDREGAAIHEQVRQRILQLDRRREAEAGFEAAPIEARARRRA